MSDEMQAYYNQRAATYEKIYEKPERQKDLATLSRELQERLKDHSILEIACGTGYWTERIATTAASIVGIDQSAETLAIAQSKNLQDSIFLQENAFSLSKVAGSFSAGFSGFWWSHIPKSRISSFLKNFHAKLKPEARVVFIDNLFVEGNSHPITRTDIEGNTYQTRELPDGSLHEVLKNFPNEQDLRLAVSEFASHVEVKFLTYFWLFDCKLKA